MFGEHKQLNRQGAKTLEFMLEIDAIQTSVMSGYAFNLGGVQIE